MVDDAIRLMDVVACEPVTPLMLYYTHYFNDSKQALEFLREYASGENRRFSLKTLEKKLDFPIDEKAMNVLSEQGVLYDEDSFKPGMNVPTCHGVKGYNEALASPISFPFEDPEIIVHLKEWLGYFFPDYSNSAESELIGMGDYILNNTLPINGHQIPSQLEDEVSSRLRSLNFETLSNHPHEVIQAVQAAHGARKKLYGGSAGVIMFTIEAYHRNPSGKSEGSYIHPGFENYVLSLETFLKDPHLD